MDALDSFLLETEFCDFKHESVQETARSFFNIYKDKQELSVKLFEFVRDNIKYQLGPWNLKASQTLKNGFGMCTNKTNLLVALLRAAGIPAGYCIYTVVGGDSFGDIAPDFLKRGVNDKSVHIICCVYLNNKWIKCDPSADFELSNKTSHLTDVTKLVNWDGQHDAVHLINPKYILNVSESLSDIDFQLKKKPRLLVKSFIFIIGNYYISFLRNYGNTFNSHKDLENSFKLWISKNKPIKYYSYQLLSKIYRVFRIYFIYE